MNVNRDVIDRLERLGIRYFVTGSTAVAVYAEPRTTRDMDVVIDLDPDRYDSVIRPAFADDYLVSDPIDVGPKVLGSVLHVTAIAKVDLIMRRRDPWGTAAMERRVRRDQPGLGWAWFSSPEDLILAKLEWSDAGRSEMQMRDCRSIVRIAPNLDWSYIERYAGALRVTALAELIREG